MVNSMNILGLAKLDRTDKLLFVSVTQICLRFTRSLRQDCTGSAHAKHYSSEQRADCGCCLWILNPGAKSWCWRPVIRLN